MKKLKVEIELFELGELESKAMRKAIKEHRLFLLSKLEYNEKYQEEYEIIYNEVMYDDAYVIESIRINEYLFYSDGSLADTVEYCGKHEKAGTSELILNGKTYQI